MKISNPLFSTLEYIQRHVSLFVKANFSPIRNIFGFPDGSVFNTSSRPLITIGSYSTLNICICMLLDYFLNAIFPFTIINQKGTSKKNNSRFV